MSNSNQSSTEEMASKQHTHLINLVRGMVPPLTSKLHKGQAGMSWILIMSSMEPDVRPNWCSWWFGRVSFLIMEGVSRQYQGRKDETGTDE